ncbi:MAG: AraC family transcriptional regulator [Culicoidibacterales bacterium]
MKPFTFSSTHLLDNIELNLYTCGSEQCLASHTYGPAVRSGYLFHFILSGRGRYTISDKTYELQSGMAFFIPPNTRIIYEADALDPWSYMWIGVVGTQVETYLTQTAISKQTPIFTISPILVTKIETIIAASQLKENKKLKIFSSLYDFFYQLCEHFPDSTQQNEIKQLTYVEDALLFIHTNYDNSILIQDIATYLAIDRSYLHRLFKKQLNLSPQQYLTNFRIERAIKLLTTTSLSIGDISRSVGYPDTLLFSKTFKKTTGISPTNYRSTQQSLSKQPD